MKRTHPWPIVVAMLCLLLSAGTGQAGQENEAERERIERVADILAMLGARDGARIADVGSAEGFYTLRIARAVAPAGKAYAVDIDAASLEKLRQRSASENISNIEVILSAPNDPKLPAGEVDAVLIRNAYHEMPEYRSILAAVARALKPGGTLVISESIHDNNRSKTRDEQVKEHEIAPGVVDTELREAGFEVVERLDPLFEFSRAPKGGFWLIRARKPG
jgi:ubiquinone/menaquinone biosynthesis C-methylase UbiE